MIKQYINVHVSVSDGVVRLVKIVNDAIKDGYEPIGGVTLLHGRDGYVQAMVKRGQNNEKTN